MNPLMVRQTTLELLCHLPNAFDDPTEIQDYQVTRIVLFTISANGDYAEYFRKTGHSGRKCRRYSTFSQRSSSSPQQCGEWIWCDRWIYDFIRYHPPIELVTYSLLLLCVYL